MISRLECVHSPTDRSQNAHLEKNRGGANEQSYMLAQNSVLLSAAKQTAHCYLGYILFYFFLARLKNYPEGEVSRFLYYVFVSNNRCELSLGLSVPQLNFLPCYVIETGILNVCSKERWEDRNRESEAPRGTN